MATDVPSPPIQQPTEPALTQSPETLSLVNHLQQMFGVVTEDAVPVTDDELRKRLARAKNLYLSIAHNGFMRTIPQVAVEVGLSVSQITPWLMKEGWEKQRSQAIALKPEVKADRTARVDNLISTQLETLVETSLAVYGEIIEDIRAMPRDDEQNLAKTLENHKEGLLDPDPKSIKDKKPTKDSKAQEQMLIKLGIRKQRPQIDIKIERLNETIAGISQLVATAKSAGLMIEPTEDGVISMGSGSGSIDSKTLTSITLALSKVTTKKQPAINITPKHKSKHAVQR